MENFTTKIADAFTSEYRVNTPTIAIQSIDLEHVQQMSIQFFQQTLRSRHVIISDYNLPGIPCDRRGLTALNSLKELVNIEGN